MNNESLLLETIIISTIILLLCVAVIAVIISLSHKHQAEQEVKVQELAVNYEKELTIRNSLHHPTSFLAGLSY